MGRLLKWLLVDIIIMSAVDWISDSYNSNNSNSVRKYESSVYQEPEVQRISEQVEEYDRSPYEFTESDLKTVFIGSYNGRSTTVLFSNTAFSSDKDTLFFDYNMPFLNKNLTLDLYQGPGFIVSDEELIVMKRERDGLVLAGKALKIYSEQYSSETEDGYLFFSIKEEGEELTFIDKKLGDEFNE